MSAQGTVFPAFIRAEYDGSSSGFAEFDATASHTLGRVSSRMQRFAADSAEVGRALKAALSNGEDLSLGRVDVGVGQLRNLAAQAKLTEATLSEMLGAARTLAVSTGDTSEATRIYLAALEAQTVEARNNVAATVAQVTAHERLQAEIDKSAGSNRALISAFNEVERGTDRYQARVRELISQVDGAALAEQAFRREVEFANRALANGDITQQQHTSRLTQLNAQMRINSESTRAQRFAYVQLGQQMQDAAIQAQMGVNPLIILTQQGSQAAYAMIGLGGRIGWVAEKLAGPWGAAVLGATTALGLLYGSMSKTSSETDRARSSNIDFSNSLTASIGLVGNYTNAIDQLTNATRSLINTQALMIDNTRAFSQNAASQLRTELSSLDAEISRIRGNQNPVLDFLFTNTDNFRLPVLQDRRAEIQKQLNQVNEALASAQTAYEARRADEAADPMAAARGRIQRERALLEQRREFTIRGNGVPLADSGIQTISEADFQREMTLLRQRENALGKKDNSARDAERAARAMDRLRESGEDASKKIANITDRFSDIQPEVAAADRALRELNDLATDFALKKPPNYAAIQQQLAAAQAAVEKYRNDALNKPMKDYLDQAAQAAAIDDLIMQGKDGQAQALRDAIALQQKQKRLSEDDLQTVLNTVQAERQRAREMEKIQQKQQAYLQAVSGVRSAISGGIAGAITGQGGNILKGIEDSLANLFATRLTDRLFGGIFDSLETAIRGGAEDVRDAGDALTLVLRDLGKDITAVRREITGETGGGTVNVPPANDNGEGPDIVVTGRRVLKTDPYTALGNELTRLLDRHLDKLGKFFSEHSDAMGVGVLSGQVLLGSSNSKIGSAVGGALGEAVGEKIGKKMTGILGDAMGPLGTIAGGLLGGLVGGLFTKKNYGSAVITGGSASDIVSSGTNGGRAQQAGTLANSVQQALANIADQFAVGVGAFNVSIGTYKDKYRVNTTGGAKMGGSSNNAAYGIVDFGDDASAAIAYAVLDAIKDGALDGRRAGTKRLLTANDDINVGLSKALKFEQVFKDLKRYTDPVGAALDEVNNKFRLLKDIFKEAGASAQELADLQDLYGREREDALKQVTEQLTGGLKSLLSELTTGDSGLSLRERLANAQAEYDPLAARVAAGDQSAYDAYSDAARTLLDIKRQIEGSGEGYFATLDQIVAMTKGAITAEEAKINAATGGATPFDTTPIVNATEQQTQAIIAGLGPWLAQIAANTNDLPALASGTGGARRIGAYTDLGRVANF